MRRVSAIAPVAILLLAACASVSDTSEKPRSPEAAEAVANHEPTVVRRDATLGVPTFTWLRGPAGKPFAVAAGTKAEDVAWAAVHRAAPTLRIGKDALASAHLKDVDDHGTGAIVARLEQKIGGIDVLGARLDVALTRAKEPVALTGFLAPSVAPRAGHASFTIGAVAAAAAAHRAMTGRAAPGFGVGEVDGGGYQRLTATGASARAKQVWFPRAAGLDAAYRVELELAPAATTDRALHAFVVDASDGSILHEQDLVSADAYTYRVLADATGKMQPYDAPTGNLASPHPTGLPDHTQLPFVASRLVSLASSPYSRNDPWLPAGATGTRGNNVDAYADLVAPDGFSAGDLRPAPSGSVFDFGFDNAAQPASTSQQRASTVQLFYALNFLHDWFYDSGFDEAAGNHQADNFGRGGADGDPLLGEVQDHGGTSNANAATPADGASSKLQFYRFGAYDTLQAAVTVPAGVGDLGTIGIADFGVWQPYDFTAPVLFVADTCRPIGVDATSKIVLLVEEPGNCRTKAQVVNAQVAGARAVLVAGATTSILPDLLNDPNLLVNMTIPVQGIMKQRSDALRTALAAGAVTARMQRRAKGLDRDPALDFALVAHEWGHTMNVRLAAALDGPQGSAINEGLADFVGLLATARAEDTTAPANAGWSGTYGIASYSAGATSTNGVYFGMRRYPYSIDFAKDPLTLKHVSDEATLPVSAPVRDLGKLSKAHNAGEVVATMLWECYAALLRDTPRLSFDDAQSRMKRYTVTALKLLPQHPTFLDVRDAFLAAAAATDERDFSMFVQAFARRGAGAGAVVTNEAGNPGVVESYVATGTDLEIVGATLADDVRSCDQDGILDDGETGKLVVTIKNVGLAEITAATATVTTATAGLALANGGRITFPPVKPFQTVSASVEVSLRTDGGVLPYALAISVTDPALAIPRAITATHHGAANVDARPVEPGALAETAWTPGSAPGSAGAGFVRKTTEGKEHWRVDDTPGVADHWLVSPLLHPSPNEPFVLGYATRWTFDSRPSDGLFFDGGVVELSEDDGVTWADVGASFAPGYGGRLTEAGDNPLRGRSGFVWQSIGYPRLDAVKANLGTAYAGKTVRLRFRFGSNTTWGSEGWDLHDLAFAGASTETVPDATVCVAPAEPPPRPPAPSRHRTRTAAAPSVHRARPRGVASGRSSSRSSPRSWRAFGQRRVA